MAAISSLETFDGNENKFEALITLVENAAQISVQDILQIAFSKMIESPLTSALRLRDGSPNIMWKELKSKVARQYSSIPFNSRTTKVFAHSQEGPDELFEMYLHHEGELLLKIHHTANMSLVSVQGMSHYTEVYGLNSRKSRESVVGHRSAQWR